jgi:hypothetical protein
MTSQRRPGSIDYALVCNPASPDHYMSLRAARLCCVGPWHSQRESQFSDQWARETRTIALTVRNWGQAVSCSAVVSQLRSASCNLDEVMTCLLSTTWRTVCLADTRLDQKGKVLCHIRSIRYSKSSKFMYTSNKSVEWLSLETPLRHDGRQKQVWSLCVDTKPSGMPVVAVYDHRSFRLLFFIQNIWKGIKFKWFVEKACINTRWVDRRRFWWKDDNKIRIDRLCRRNVAGEEETWRYERCHWKRDVMWRHMLI